MIYADHLNSNVKIKINAFTKRMYAMVKMIAWMVVMTLLVVAVLDCCFPVVKNGQKGLSSSMVKFRKHKRTP